MDSNSTVTMPMGTLDIGSFGKWTHTLQTVIVATLVFAVCSYIPKFQQKARLAKLPAFGSTTKSEKERQSFLASAKSKYLDGYKSFRDSVYRMREDDGEDHVVVPLNLLPELRKLPDDVLSFPGAIAKTMEIKYTKLSTDATLAIHTIKSDLTPALSRLNPTICAEVDATMREYMPPCNDWTEVYLNQKLVDIVAKVSGRIFVGPELSKDPEYLECGTKYTVYVIQAVQAIKKLRPWTRPFLAPRLPEIKRLRAMETRAAKHLEPIVRERIEAAKDDPNWQQPDDMLQWLLNRGEEHGLTSVKDLAKIQLDLIFAAVHTTTMTATNVLYTLAVTPEYVEPLREEIRNVMAENGGQITTRALQQMVKLDSYMKEVTRIFPPGITSFGRRVLKGITLSNGQHIPAGVIIEVPSHAIYSDEQHYPDPSTFDGFRHYKLRNGGTATDHARNQFVTTNESNLAFGYGRHACPGRFFAANEIKMILARLILDYDIKMPGEVAPGLAGRHPNIEMGRSSTPHPGKTLMLKRLEV